MSGETGITTCVESLLTAGKRCAAGCQAQAVVATLTAETIRDLIGYVEHTRCGYHINDSNMVATKTLRLREWP